MKGRNPAAQNPIHRRSQALAGFALTGLDILPGLSHGNARGAIDPMNSSPERAEPCDAETNSPAMLARANSTTPDQGIEGVKGATRLIGATGLTGGRAPSQMRGVRHSGAVGRDKFIATNARAKHALSFQHGSGRINHPRWAT